MTAQDIFDKFKNLHPHNFEPYVPTSANLSRWKWHIDNQPLPVHFPPIAENIAPNPDALRIANKRRFSSFDEMPKHMKFKYMTISALFPGLELYACGSRVKGEYIDETANSAVRWMRSQFRKSQKIESDYDFIFQKKPDGITFEQVRKKLPAWADVLVHGVPDDEKILIPMGWDFERLPLSEHQKVADLFFSGNWGALMQIHNHYQLSPQNFCCDKRPVIMWFRWAIEEVKIIQYDKQ